MRRFPKTSDKDMDIILKIAKRASKISESHWAEYNETSAGIDLIYAHDQVTLDLEALLETDDFNFVHDVFGIALHMDRSTGELDSRFLPRFALRSCNESKGAGHYSRF
jgi:hypothetical protein